MKTRRTSLWIALFLLSILLVAGGTAGYLFLKRVIKGVPSVAFLKTFIPVTTSILYDRNGRVIGSFYREKREYLPLHKMPPLILHSVLAVEDAKFYRHGALAYGSIIRAAISDALAGYLREGASTITQQLARNIFLNHKKNLVRKLREAILSYRIEQVLTKDEILELYLNQIYFGEGAYGVQAAAKEYFGKDVRELTLPETALIAGLIRSPIEFSPYLHPQASKKRQLVVLKRMESVGFVTHDELKKAYAQNLVFRRRTSASNPNAYFLEYVRQRLEKIMTPDQLYGGGLRIFTTLDARIQEIALHSLRKGLRTIDRRKGFRGPVRKLSIADLKKEIRQSHPMDPADRNPGILGRRVEGVVTRVSSEGVWFDWEGVPGFIPIARMLWAKKILDGPNFDRDVKVLEPFSPSMILHPGDVVMVHLTGFYRIENRYGWEGGLDQVPLIQGCVVAINPQTGGVLAMVGGYSFRRSKFNRAYQAIRQPGSSFKMIDYGAALEHGYAPGRILEDEPLVFFDSIHKRIWRPKDYERRFLGPVPMRKALAESINLATIRMVRHIGVGSVIDFARRLGISTPLNHDLSLALGSSGVRPLELTSAYSVIANQGVRNHPHALTRVLNYQKTTVYEHVPTPQNVYDPANSYLLTSMLQSVIKDGTGKDALVLSKLLAGKTGTTNDFKDAWFIGFSPNIAVGVYVGMDDHRSMGRGEFGAKAALPVWIDIMRQVLPLIPDVPFAIPDNVVEVRIDPKTGLRTPMNNADFVVEIYKKGKIPSMEVSQQKVPDTDFYNIPGSQKSPVP
ncbi:MAG: penicillin-binding protein 1A [Leptospirales bacterium]